MSAPWGTKPVVTNVNDRCGQCCCIRETHVVTTRVWKVSIIIGTIIIVVIAVTIIATITTTSAISTISYKSITSAASACRGVWSKGVVLMSTTQCTSWLNVCFSNFADYLLFKGLKVVVNLMR